MIGQKDKGVVRHKGKDEEGEKKSDLRETVKGQIANGTRRRIKRKGKKIIGTHF